MSDLTMWLSPLTHRIFIGRTKGNSATQKQDVTHQCVNGAVQHLVATGNKDVLVTLDNGTYRVTITKKRTASGAFVIKR